MSLHTDKNLAAFLDPLAYTVHCVYPGQHPNVSTVKRYTYVTNIPGIMPGDTVIVPNSAITDHMQDLRALVEAAEKVAADGDYRNSDLLMPRERRVSVPVRPDNHIAGTDPIGKLCMVVAVDKEVTIAPGHSTEFKWLVGKLDLSYYLQLLNRNDHVVAETQKAWRTQATRHFRDNVLDAIDPEARARIQSAFGINNDAPAAIAASNAPQDPASGAQPCC
jgi:hypothetical protein